MMHTDNCVSRPSQNDDVGVAGEPFAEIRLSDIIAALSSALDITEGQPEGHAARTSVLALRLARELGLNHDDTESLFYAALLKDLGCSSNAAKMCYLFAADDRTLKRDVKTINWQKLTDNVRYVQRHARPGGKTWQRILQFASLVVQGPNGPKQLVKIRCERGASIVRSLGFPESTAQAILHLDEHFNGKGHPHGLKGESISLLGRILCLCQTMEVFWREQGLSAALNVARSRKGSWFDPQLVTVFEAVARDQEFCDSYLTRQPTDMLQNFAPAQTSRRVTERELDHIAVAFSEVVDAKSPWTFRHSKRVAEIAVGIGAQLHFSRSRLRQLHRAALLHDIGKLGVSNLILDKPGKLTDEEFSRMKMHPEFSENILRRVPSFSTIATFAGTHHEKLNGTGYYRGLPGDALDMESRILVIADIFEALTAERPYREGMPIEKVLEILRRDANRTICPVALEGLLKWLEHRQLESRINEQHQALSDLLGELHRCEGC